jgi:hypothetical protein
MTAGFSSTGKRQPGAVSSTQQGGSAPSTANVTWSPERQCDTNEQSPRRSEKAVVAAQE